MKYKIHNTICDVHTEQCTQIFCACILYGGTLPRTTFCTLNGGILQKTIVQFIMYTVYYVQCTLRVIFHRS